MSFRDKLEKYRKKPDPLEQAVMRILDPSRDSPDIFYKMDEIDGVRVLRKFDESSGERLYCGTYEVLYTDERFDMECIILRRIANEEPVLTEDNMRDEWGKLIFARYVPAYGSRILLYELPDATAAWLEEQYQKSGVKDTF